MAPEQPHDSGGTELGRFLRARRSQITPADVGFTPGTGVRRTPGLRREEVAALAGVSIDYYTRLERGKETRPSPAVTDALARALKLDADEHEHHSIHHEAPIHRNTRRWPPDERSRRVMRALLWGRRECCCLKLAKRGAGEPIAWRSRVGPRVGR